MLLKTQVNGDIRLTVKVVWSGFLEKFKEYRVGVKIIDSEEDQHEKFLQCYQAKVLTLPL